MKETASDGVPTRDTAKNPLMKELVETSPEIPPAVARQREEEEEQEEEERAKYVQTIIDCGKKLKQHMTEEERVKNKWRMKDGVPVQPSRKGGRRFPVSLLLLDAVCYDEQLLLRDTHPQRAPCREKDESVLSLYIAIYRPNL